MKKNVLIKIVSSITLVLIMVVLGAIIILNSNGGLKAADNRSLITVSKSSTISIYVTGVGVDLVSSSSDKDIYSVEQNTDVTIQAVNESHIFTNWAIENISNLDVTKSLLGETNVSLNKTTFKMGNYDIELSCLRREPTSNDYGKYMNNRFIIDSVDKMIALQTIIAHYKEVKNNEIKAGEYDIIDAYDEFFGEVEEYKNNPIKYVNDNKLYELLDTGYFLVANNLSVFDEKFNGIGTANHPFNGVMCGDNGQENSQVVLVITDKANTTDHYGLFAYLGDKAVVRDLKLRSSIGITDSGTETIYAGGLAAYAKNSLLVNIDIASNISVECSGKADVYSGGFIGYSEETSVADIAELKSTRNNNSNIVTTTGNAYSGFFAGRAKNCYVKEFNMNISGLNMTTRNNNTWSNTAANRTNIYSGLMFGYIENDKRIVLEDINLTSTTGFKVDNFINGGDCYTGGIAGYVEDKASVELGSICLENEAEHESEIRSNTTDGNSQGNAYAGGIFARVLNSNVVGLSGFKNRIKVITVDDKNAYVYNPVFTGNITVEAMQNGKADGKNYGKVIAGGIVGKGYIDINGSDTNSYLEDETHLVLSKSGAFNVKATQSSLASNSTKANDVEHCISSAYIGLINNTADDKSVRNINLYGENVNSIATRDIGSNVIGDIHNSLFISYINETNVENIGLYFNSSNLSTNSLSYEAQLQANGNNAHTGALIGLAYNSSSDKIIIENISLKGVNWTDLTNEIGTKLKVLSIQNTKPHTNNNYRGENYVGGLIGQLFKYNVSGLSYLGSETEEDYIRMSGHEDPDSAFCGGLIGFMKVSENYPENVAEIYDSTIKNATILGEATNVDTGINTPDIFVGGVIGACYNHSANNTNILLDNLSVINCNIKAVGNEREKVYGSGIVGSIKWETNGDYRIENCYVMGSNISAHVHAVTTNDVMEAFASGIGNRESSNRITYNNNAIIDTVIDGNDNIAGVSAAGEGTFNNNYSNAILTGTTGTTIYGIAVGNGDSDNYYVGTATSGRGSAISLDKLQVVSTTGDVIFNNLNRDLEYLAYVLSYNNGYKSGVNLPGTEVTEYRVYISPDDYENLPDRIEDKYTSFTVNSQNGTQVYYYETDKVSSLKTITANTYNDLLDFPADTYNTITVDGNTYYIPVLSRVETTYHNKSIQGTDGVTYWYNNTDFTEEQRYTANNGGYNRINAINNPVTLYFNTGQIGRWDNINSTTRNLINGITEKADSKPSADDLSKFDYVSLGNNRYVKALTTKPSGSNYVEFIDLNGATRYIENVITSSAHHEYIIGLGESKENYSHEDTRGHYKIVTKGEYDKANPLYRYAYSYTIDNLSGENIITFFGQSNKSYEDTLNVWVNFKGQGTNTPLDLSKSKEQLASEGWFNMGEKIIYNFTGDIVTEDEITDIEILYGYNFNEFTESRKNNSKLYEYVLTKDQSIYNFDIYTHDDIAYLKIKFVASTESTYFESFSNSLVAYGDYVFNSKIVNIDGVEKKQYEFILYPNAEIVRNGTVNLSFIDTSGRVSANTFVFKFNKNNLKLVGGTYASYTPPLNYYELDNKNATVYCLGAESITKFIPVITKANDLVATEYVDEKYIDLISYSATITNGTFGQNYMKSSGEFTAPNDGDAYGTIVLTPKADSELTGDAITIQYKLYASYIVKYSVIGMTTDCIPNASYNTNYYFPIYIDNGFAGTPEVAKIDNDNIVDLIQENKVTLLDELGNELDGFSDGKDYYLLVINQNSYQDDITINIEFPLIYSVTFDLQCGSFNSSVSEEEMTKTFVLRNTDSVLDFFGYNTAGVYKHKTDGTTLTPKQYEALEPKLKLEYELVNSVYYTELTDWVKKNTAFGYVFTGFYLVDNANDSISYGEKFEDVLEIPNFTLNTSLIFYARWSFLIELVEAPGTTIETSFADSFMYEISDSTLVNKTVRVPINNNRGYVFTVEKDASFIGEAYVKAYIVTKNHEDDQVLTEIYIEKYHENMYLYFIPPEQITGYLMIVTSISNSGFIVGEHTATVTDEILPEDGVLTFKYVVNHRNNGDDISYIYDAGTEKGKDYNLNLIKDFRLRFFKQTYHTGSASRINLLSGEGTALDPRTLPKGSIVEVYYQKIVNGNVVNRIVGIANINNDTTDELLLSDFMTIDQEVDSKAFPVETFRSFLGSSEYVSEVYYFVVTPPNGYDGEASNQIMNYVIEGGYVDGAGYVSGVRTSDDFANIPLEDYEDIHKESSVQTKIYSVTPSRDTYLDDPVDSSYEYSFVDNKEYEIFKMKTENAEINGGKLVLNDGVGMNTIIQTNKLPFEILGLDLVLGYGTGNINIYGGYKSGEEIIWKVVETVNVNDIQYKEYNIEFVGESITEKFDYFKIDNISGNAIRVEDMKVYALSTGMTYEIDKFEFNPGTTDISFRGSVINDVRHDGKTFMLAVQLKDNKGEIVLDIPNTLTLQTSISGVVSAAIDVDQKGRVTAYFDLTKIIDSNNITTFDFSINVPNGYKLHAILLLEVENVTKPAMSEVREVIVIN